MEYGIESNGVRTGPLARLWKPLLMAVGLLPPAKLVYVFQFVFSARSRFMHCLKKERRYSK
jgi:hypothetical protein